MIGMKFNYHRKMMPKRERLMNKESNAREKKLNRLQVKLNNDEDIRDEYKRIFGMYQNLGITEQVPEDEIACANIVYHMPRRPVFNTSAKCSRGVSFNNCIVTGPSLNLDLAEISLRFRQWPFVITADIANAF